MEEQHIQSHDKINGIRKNNRLDSPVKPENDGCGIEMTDEGKTQGANYIFRQDLQARPGAIDLVIKYRYSFKGSDI